MLCWHVQMLVDAAAEVANGIIKAQLKDQPFVALDGLHLRMAWAERHVWWGCVSVQPCLSGSMRGGRKCAAAWNENS